MLQQIGLYYSCVCVQVYLKVEIMCICNFDRCFQILSYTVIHNSTSNIWEHPFLYTCFNTVFLIFWIFTNLLRGKKEMFSICFWLISLIMIENIFMFKNYPYFHFEELLIYILAHFFRDFFERFGDLYIAYDY